MSQIRHGTPEFRRTNLALFSAGFATFALMYSVQPLMPQFAHDFHVGAAQSSLSLSLTTGILAPVMIIVGVFSESRGRKSIMVASLFASSVLTLACAFVTGWRELLVLRALAGVTFAGFPAISMAYLSEEMHPTSIGLAMGLSIGGNGLGGMTGRLLAAFVTGVSSWRYAMGVIAVIGLAGAVIFWRTLPPSRHFTARPFKLRGLARTFSDQLRDPRLVSLFAIGFLLMGSFVGTYNYVTYHLLAPPYSLSQATAGSIFLVYPVGIFASAYIGSRADRVGRGRMLLLMVGVSLGGLLLMFARPLPFVVLGIAAVTFGFFGGHSVASSWVGLRAHMAKAQATALYLLFYYVGASIAGSVGGMFWDWAGWNGVTGFIGALLVIALGMAVIAARERAEPGESGPDSPAEALRG